jgi:hypothetical protein
MRLISYLLIAAGPLILSGCGTTSLLAGDTITFQLQDGTDTINLSTSGTYTEQAPTCFDAGTWKDLNPGSSDGVVCFYTQSGTGVCASYLDTWVSYNYIISNNIVAISNAQVGNPQCN